MSVRVIDIPTIQVTTDVRILVEDTCVTIEALTKPTKRHPDAQPRWATVGYYADLKGACRALVGRHMALVAELPPEASVMRIVEAIERAERAVVRAVEGR